MSYEEEDEEFIHNPFIKSYGLSGDEDILHNNSKQEISTTIPKILIMGPKKSGKTSIQKVIFQKMSPNETYVLESTSKILKHDINYNSLLQFHIW